MPENAQLFQRFGPKAGESPNLGPYQQQQKALNYLGVRGPPPSAPSPVYNGPLLPSLGLGGNAQSDCPEATVPSGAVQSPGTQSTRPPASVTTG